MSDTIPYPHHRARHLTAVGSPPVPPPTASSAEPRPVLRPLALLEVARADMFLVDLDNAVRDGRDDIRSAVLLGQAVEHLAAMLDLVRALTGLPQ